MKKETVINLAGSAQAVADLLGISPSAVSQWPDDKDIPEARVWQLRVLRPEWFAEPVSSGIAAPAIVTHQAA